MSRLPGRKREELDEQGRAVWDGLTASRGDDLISDEGALVGPFNAWVHAPEAGARLAALGSHLRFGTSLERRLLELAIVTTGAHWHAEFEWWAHAPMARSHGVADSVLEALAKGTSPVFAADDERVVHSVASQLARTSRVDADTYAAAQELLGDAGMVELVSLCGYYTMVSFTLNAFEVPLPPGAVPVWKR